MKREMGMKRYGLLFLGLVLSITVCAQSWVEQGDSCQKAFDDYGALKYYEEAQRVKNDDAIKMKIAGCHYRRADYRKCVGLLEKVTLDSLSHEAFRQLFYAYKYLGEPRKQIACGRKLVDRFPKDGQAVADLCLALNADVRNPKSSEEAKAYAQKYTTSYDPDHIAVNRQLADACFFMKEYDLANNVYQKLLAEGDSTYGNYLSLGICYEELEQQDKAIPMFEKAVQFCDSSKAAPFYHLAKLYMTVRNDYVLATTCLNKAISLVKADPLVVCMFYNTLGEAYAKQQEYQQAIYAWQEVLKLNGNSMDANYNIAECFRAQGDLVTARSYYRYFISIANHVEKPSQALLKHIAAAKMLIGDNSSQTSPVPAAAAKKK